MVTVDVFHLFEGRLLDQFLGEMYPIQPAHVFSTRAMTCHHMVTQSGDSSFTVTLICHNVTLSKRKKAQEYG